MNRRFIDWIWHIRGSLPLAPGQSGDDAFGRLDPLFHEPGTSHDRMDDTLTFRKKGQAAQDKMSIFDSGVLQVRKGAAGLVLHYRLSSRALLFCFLAPLLFLGFAQLTIAVGKIEKATAHAAEKKPEKKDASLPQHPIDKFLGAPAPEKPKKDKAGKSGEDDKKPSPKAAYVFAAIFAALYGIGRVLEGKLVRSLFRKRLLGA
ncbi:hypothetical protein Sj15T_35690 [Sphingobium sp. TA15]|uniref:Uncharacterized protein n=2 Tax=Sphingobium indicum TaxID=332055 RepID=D4Z7M3_SPHIU|nr:MULTISPECIES: hypothetical protein [Sphingobium]EQB02628.1 hypothetical protein L286_14150 [Sphingobium sp. HDIP04]KER35893.1 hypothetical protein AL00_14215 [Sphingobium indicum F2]BAI98492.1 hypothetical protein SJA_C2-01290 [Sphingobium indicum UT26S]BDD68548.1 hypothetical protein Sj15T_35690 [Sphingobium sp. TA15]